MKYVSVKCNKHLPEDKRLVGFDAEFPVLCHEFDTLAEAQACDPEAYVMTADEYRGFKFAMDALHEDVLNPKPGFFAKYFGGKK